MASKILRRPEVEARLGLSRSTIYDWMKEGKFPAPIALGKRMVGWRESDIEAWLDGLPKRNVS
ncbi:AlpA family transcriptional regulator [Ruegeria pomeroyi]|nr:AlpA family transcriptional regulator [Ruegeria pomeroyi]